MRHAAIRNVNYNNAALCWPPNMAKTFTIRFYSLSLVVGLLLAGAAPPTARRAFLVASLIFHDNKFQFLITITLCANKMQ